MKAAILAVGTELTTGQILNRNASWISEKLKAFGMLTECHLTIPDDRPLILESLEFCAKHAGLIFVTGGLGPTSDDFTRDIISQWCGQELEFDPQSWKQLVDRLTARNYQIKEIQRQQCFFPKGTRVLQNSQGTANGFWCEFRGKQIYVLPGPPREIEAIWDDHIDAEIKKLTASMDRHLTLSWDTMGYGESQIAERVEKIVQGTHFEIGYRVHLPYVEVKISFLESERAVAKNYIEALDQELSDCTVVKNGEDILKKLLISLADFNEIEISDLVTGTILAQRFLTGGRSFFQDRSWTLSAHLPATSKLTENQIQLSLEKLTETDVRATVRTSKFQSDKILSSQLVSRMSDRKIQIFAEQSLIFWYQELRSKK